MATNDSVKVLVVEDAISLGVVYVKFLERDGFDATHVSDGASAIAAIQTGDFSVILLDLQLPDMNGQQIIEHVKSSGIDVSIIVITSNASLNIAVNSIRSGAHDFLVKPIDKQRLLTTVNNALETVSLKKQIRTMSTRCERGEFHKFVGSSLPMQSIYQMIENVAHSNATVFITGESGTGKELCADAIHMSGDRANKPFVALNCGAIPKELIESEIFGHLRGSFTGAINDRIGVAKQADGGTLFLDEICEMELSLQTKLLRFLQTGKIQPVGSAVEECVDVRIICATNRDPFNEVRTGRFREDLFYRLHVVPIHLPRLRDRQNDIIEISNYFLHRFNEQENKDFKEISADAEAALKAHDWPGNVRELQNLIHNGVVMNSGETITASMLRNQLSRMEFVQQATPAGETSLPIQNAVEENYRQVPGPVLGKKLYEIEKEAIEQTIEACNGSIPKAAIILGVSPSTIYRKKESWQLEGAA
jgi:DNA-binding NtrC family response regulator